MPFLIWYSIRYGVALRPLYLKVQQQFGSMTSALQENVSGNRVVRAFAQEQAENERFEAELEELFEDLKYRTVRDNILSGKPRIDGRDTRTVRALDIQTGVLAKAHGSALFTRGETQALVTATLGGGLSRC